MRTTVLGLRNEIATFSIVEEVWAQHWHQPAARLDVFQQPIQLRAGTEVVILSANVSVWTHFLVEQALYGFLVAVLDVKKHFVLIAVEFFAISLHYVLNTDSNDRLILTR